MREKLKQNKRSIIAISAILAIGLAVGIWVIFFKQPSAPAPKITKATARLGSVAVAVENDGVAQADKIALNFSQTGILDSLNVKVGDSVAKGDILAALNGSKLVAQVDQAQANYSANLSKANRLAPGGEEVVAKQQLLDAARTALTAEQAIYNDAIAKYGVGSSQEIAEASKLRKAESDVAVADSQLAITKDSYNDAKYAANAAYASVSAARASLYDLNITSPMDGIITSVNGAVGQAFGGSQTTQNSFITVTNPSSLKIVSQFDEEDISKISVGQAIKAEFAAVNATLKGHVTYVAPVAVTDQNGTATYEVHSLLDPDQATILDGMTASVSFVTKEVDNVVVVPNKSIKRVDGKSVISYYDGIGVVMTKQVTTGFTDGTSVAITKGLEPGDEYLIIE